MTDTPTTNLDRARRFYGLVETGRWAEAEACVAEDFTTVEAPDLPFGGVSRGKSAVKESFEVLQQQTNLTGVDTIETTAGGDYVISLIDLVTRAEDGSELRLHLAETMRFVDGLIVEVRPFYFDHDAVRRAVAAKSA